MTGSSADKGLRAVDTALFDQGHAVCGGVKNGKSTVVGFSSGSKIWSNQYLPISQLLAWFGAAAIKLRDTKPRVVRTMFDKLPVASRIRSLPSKVIAADLPAAAYERTNARVAIGGKEAWLIDLRVDVLAQTNTSVNLMFSSNTVRAAQERCLASAIADVPRFDHAVSSSCPA